MSDFVELNYRRNRGWPWPEDSFGLTPMFGEDGWCRACGVPKHAQTGSMVLQRRGLTVAEGAWVPHGHYDVICLSSVLAEEAARRFDLDLLPVRWPRMAPGEAMQIVVPTVGEAWFDPEELRVRAIERHGEAGTTCPVCGVWRWMPLVLGMSSPLRVTVELGESVDIAASPEWFGDGWKAFRQILMRRELAEFLAKASPGDFIAP